MKIALVAPFGNIGSAIAAEALSRGHQVTGLVRTPRETPATLAGITLKTVNIEDSAAFAQAAQGADVVASAVAPAADAPQSLYDLSLAIVRGTQAAGINRLVVVGGAGSLEVAPGVQLVDTPQFPDAYLAVARAHREVFRHLQAENPLDWTFFAPAGLIGPGERRGTYRSAVKTLLTDSQGQSQISYADYAIAFVDELEAHRHPRQIITAAY